MKKRHASLTIMVSILCFALLFSGCSSGRQVAPVAPGASANAFASTGGAHPGGSLPRDGALKSNAVVAMESDFSSFVYQESMPETPMVKPDVAMNTEDYASIRERDFVSPFNEPLSTFSADVNTASWSNIRRFINMGMSVPADAVRIEEMINYFPYRYAESDGEEPFAIHPELGICPWNTDRLLMRIGIQGKRMDTAVLPPSNLVFLLDVSGSMNDPLKLPLVKSAFSLLVEQLQESDRVSIVTYAGADLILLDGAEGGEKAVILSAINDLEAGGSTAGAQGIVTAYELAKRHFLPGGNNRVILATDGDFNIGVSSDGELTRLIEKQRKTGVFLSVLGFGTGNIKDNKMEALANNGNGHYAYIDSVAEARKVLVEEMGGTLFTIAKDVKLQVEFNPATVKGYRLIGYENRMLQTEDFNNDKKDAGDIGAGHSVTALYEIIPATSGEEVSGVDPLRYQSAGEDVIVDRDSPFEKEWMTIKIRYKEPDGDNSRLLSLSIPGDALIANPSDDFLFQAAVAEAGLVLRNSAFKSNAVMDHAVSLAVSVLGTDEGGYRREFVELMSRHQVVE